MPEADAGDRAVEVLDVERLCQALRAEEQRNLRLLADFDNFRRRDTLARVLAAGSIDAAFYEGVAATWRLLLSALRGAGAEVVESIGSELLRPAEVVVATGPRGIEPWR